MTSQEAPNKSDCIVYMPGYHNGDGDMLMRATRMVMVMIMVMMMTMMMTMTSSTIMTVMMTMMMR